MLFRCDTVVKWMFNNVVMCDSLFVGGLFVFVYLLALLVIAELRYCGCCFIVVVWFWVSCCLDIIVFLVGVSLRLFWWLLFDGGYCKGFLILWLLLVVGCSC